MSIEKHSFLSQCFSMEPLRGIEPRTYSFTSTSTSLPAADYMRVRLYLSPRGRPLAVVRAYLKTPRSDPPVADFDRNSGFAVRLLVPWAGGQVTYHGVALPAELQRRIGNVLLEPVTLLSEWNRSSRLSICQFCSYSRAVPRQ